MNKQPVGSGFTLVEMIVLIIVFFGSLAALLSVAIEAAKRVGENNDSVIAMQLAQEQAEYFVALRRRDYNLVAKLAGTNSMPVPGYAAFNRSYSVSACPANLTQGCSSSLPCPPNLGMANGCMIVAIDVTKGHTTLAGLKLLLANY